MIDLTPLANAHVEFGTVQSNSMIYHELETERLLLRIFTPDDHDDFFSIIEDPEVRKFLADGQTLSKADTLDTVNRFAITFKKRGFGRWALIHKEDGKLIGYCGLVVLDEEIGIEIAYLLSKDYWGRGLATEAARACLRYGFEELNLERIAAVSIVEHSASRRVMERLGMLHVKDFNYFQHDCTHYVITTDEFRIDDAPYSMHEIPLTDEAP